jgi:hypothetical protein
VCDIEGIAFIVNDEGDAQLQCIFKGKDTPANLFGWFGCAECIIPLRR